MMLRRLLFAAILVCGGALGLVPAFGQSDPTLLPDGTHDACGNSYANGGWDDVLNSPTSGPHTDNTAALPNGLVFKSSSSPKNTMYETFGTAAGNTVQSSADFKSRFWFNTFTDGPYTSILGSHDNPTYGASWTRIRHRDPGSGETCDNMPLRTDHVQIDANGSGNDHHYVKDGFVAGGMLRAQPNIVPPYIVSYTMQFPQGVNRWLAPWFFEGYQISSGAANNPGLGYDFTGQNTGCNGLQSSTALYWPMCNKGGSPDPYYRYNEIDAPDGYTISDNTIAGITNTNTLGGLGSVHYSQESDYQAFSPNCHVPTWAYTASTGNLKLAGAYQDGNTTNAYLRNLNTPDFAAGPHTVVINFRSTNQVDFIVDGVLVGTQNYCMLTYNANTPSGNNMAIGMHFMITQEAIPQFSLAVGAYSGGPGDNAVIANNDGLAADIGWGGGVFNIKMWSGELGCVDYLRPDNKPAGTCAEVVQATPSAVVATESLAINAFPNPKASTAFTINGSILNASSAPTLQYQDGTGAWQALPGGASVTSTGFSFTHPGMAMTGAATVSVRDAANIAVTTLASFSVVGAESADQTTVTTVGPAITDGNGATYTISSGGQVIWNGAAQTGTSNVVELAYVSHVAYQMNSAGAWYSFSTNNGILSGVGPVGCPLASCTVVVTPPPSGGTGQFVISGGTVTDPDGNLWIGRGFNANANQMSQVISNGIARFPGLNVVRVPTGGPDGYPGCSTYTAMATWAKTNKVLLLVEDHPFPSPPAYTGSTLTTETNWYATIAACFTTNPYFGFGTMNEPSPGPDDSYGSNEAEIVAQEVAIYNAIRGAGNHNIVSLMAGIGGGNPQTIGSSHGFSAASFANMTNAWWEIHYYGWIPGYGDTNQTDVNNGLIGSVANGQGILGAQSIQSHDGVMPVFVGEFSPQCGNAPSSFCGVALNAQGSALDQTTFGQGYFGQNGDQLIASAPSVGVQYGKAGYTGWAWNADGTSLLTSDGGATLSAYWGAKLKAAIAATAAQYGGAQAGESLSISPIANQHTSTAFTVTGSISGVSAIPTLQYQDNSGAWVALPSGSTVTKTSFAFTHPGMSLNSAATLSVRDANTSSTATVSFSVIGSESSDQTTVKTVGPAITDALGGTYSISSGGQVIWNGAVQGGTANVVELAYVNHIAYQLNSAGSWYSFSTSNGTLSGAGPVGCPLTSCNTTGTPPPDNGTWQSVDLTVAGMTLPSGKPFHFNYLLPPNYDATKTYPVMVWEHPTFGNTWYESAANGGGSQPVQVTTYEGAQNFGPGTTFRDNYQWIILVPYADQTDGSGNQGDDGVNNFGGWSNNGSTGSCTHASGDTGPNVCGVLGMIDWAKANLAVNSNQVFCQGFSLGGIGCEDMLLKYNTVNGSPKVFAAGVTTGGVLEINGYGSGPTTANKNTMQSVPLWNISGQQDGTSIPAHWNLPMWQLLTNNTTYPTTINAATSQASGSQYLLSYLPGVGHSGEDATGTFMQATAPILNWLQLQSASGTVVTPPPPPNDGSGSPTTWSPTDEINITLSSDKLTATSTGIGGVRTSSSKSTGKACIAVTLSNLTHSQSTGIANSTEPLNGLLGGSGSLGLALLTDWGPGQYIYKNGATVSQGSHPSVTGERILFALDADAHKLWISDSQMATDSTPWDNSGTDNPATGVGGIDVSFVGTSFYLMANTQDTGSQWVLDPTPSGCPSGFPSWGLSTSTGHGPFLIDIGSNDNFPAPANENLFGQPFLIAGKGE